MTGYDREVLRRRLGHVFAFFTGRAYVKKVDMAESAGGWSLCRGLHRTAALKFPEYGDKFQVHVQQPFNELNLYTATLTILGEDEPLLQTKLCPTPVEALSNLRIMIMVCEDPNTKAKREEQRKKQERNEREDAEQEIHENPVDSEDQTKEQSEDEMRAEEKIRVKEKLAREQWGFTLARLGGKKSRHAAGVRNRMGHAAEREFLSQSKACSPRTRI